MTHRRGTFSLVSLSLERTHTKQTHNANLRENRASKSSLVIILSSSSSFDIVVAFLLHITLEGFSTSLRFCCVLSIPRRGGPSSSSSSSHWKQRDTSFSMMCCCYYYYYYYSSVLCESHHQISDWQNDNVGGGVFHDRNVKAVKTKRIPPDQRLIFAGSNWKTGERWRIQRQKESTLHLVLRLPGGPAKYRAAY